MYVIQDQTVDEDENEDVVMIKSCENVKHQRRSLN